MLLSSTMTIDERNTLISILQSTIRDVVESDNNNDLLVNDVNGEVASVKDVIILSINGEDVITMLRQRQRRRTLSARLLLRGSSGPEDLHSKRKLQTSSPTATMIVEYELVLEESCVAACEETMNTTQLYYEENVIEYLETSIDDGSFTTALHDNVDEIQRIVADSSVNATTNSDDSENVADANDSAVINLLQNAQVVNGTFSTVRVVVETTTSDDDDIGASQDVNYTYPIMPSLDDTTDDDGTVLTADGEVHNITLPPTISSMPTSPTVSPSPTNIATSTISIDTASLAPSSNATLINSSENIGNNETQHVNVTDSSLGTISPTISSNPTQLPASISPTSDPLIESLSMIPTSETSNFLSPIVAMSNVPTSSPEPSVLVTTNGSTTMFDDVGLGNNDTSNITNETTIVSPPIPIANNTMNETTTNISTVTLDDLSAPYTLSLSINSETPLAQYGSAVAISNDGRYVVVSAKDGMNEEGVDVGAVYIYSMDRELSPPEEEEGLTLLQVLYGESSKDEYGNALALSHDGKRLVVGSRSENNQMGAIRIYQLDNNII